MSTWQILWDLLQNTGFQRMICLYREEIHLTFKNSGMSWKKILKYWRRSVIHIRSCLVRKEILSRSIKKVYWMRFMRKGSYQPILSLRMWLVPISQIPMVKWPMRLTEDWILRLGNMRPGGRLWWINRLIRLVGFIILVVNGSMEKLWHRHVPILKIQII